MSYVLSQNFPRGHSSCLWGCGHLKGTLRCWQASVSPYLAPPQSCSWHGSNCCQNSIFHGKWSSLMTSAQCSNLLVPSVTSSCLNNFLSPRFSDVYFKALVSHRITVSPTSSPAEDRVVAVVWSTHTCPCFSIR